MTGTCFLDCETSSLRVDRRAWEVGLIVREEGREDREHHWFIDVRDLDLGNADVMSLKIGRFYERHPQMTAGNLNGGGNSVLREDESMRRVERLTRGAHIVGAVPNFDTEVLGARMRANDTCPSWHYHLICVEALAVGYLHGLYRFGRGGIADAMANGDIPGLPWKSDDLSAALGVTVSEEERHTALGDAKWAMRIYDAVTGGPS